MLSTSFQTIPLMSRCPCSLGSREGKTFFSAAVLLHPSSYEKWRRKGPPLSSPSWLHPPSSWLGSEAEAAKQAICHPQRKEGDKTLCIRVGRRKGAGRRRGNPARGWSQRKKSKRGEGGREGPRGLEVVVGCVAAR